MHLFRGLHCLQFTGGSLSDVKPSIERLALYTAIRMGSALRAVDVGLHGVRDVACGGYHTCVLLDDDSIRRK